MDQSHASSPLSRTDASITASAERRQDSPFQTCWTWLGELSNRKKCLCKRQRNCLTVIFDSGEVQHIPLPFPVSHMIPLSTGLLVQRSTDRETGTPGFPTLFTLLHPMNDFCPVAIKISTHCGYVTDPHLEIVSSCPRNRDHVLLYHTTSHCHTVWEVKPATAEDIPVHVSTPHQSKKSLNSTPRSTSAPALQSTPGLKFDTPVQMVLTGNKKLRIACNLQYKMSPHPFSGGVGGRVTGAVKLGSGRSPFVAKFQTPPTIPKRSKSVSPPHRAGRLSPFSQTVNSWSTVFSEESAVSLDQLLPQIAMHKLLEVPEKAAGVASTFFGCGSLLSAEDSYFYYTVPEGKKLWILSADPHCSEKPIHTAVSATQSVPVQSLNVIVVLSPSNLVSVYSGTLKVCTIEQDWLLRNHYGSGGGECGGEVSVVGLKEGKGTQFCIELSSGNTLCCTLPPVYAQLSVELCVKALKAALPTETAHSVLASYYRACIEMYPTPFSLDHFQKWLLSCLQLPPLGIAAPTLYQVKGVPAMGLFTAAVFSHAVPKSQPVAEVLPEPTLVQYRQGIFKVLHLVYQELKLYSGVDSLPLMAALLHHLASSLGLPSHCDLYHTDHPSLLPSSLGHPLPPPSDGGGLEGEERMECGEGGGEDTPPPPNLMSHLNLMLTGGGGKAPFQMLTSKVCKRTKQIVKLYALYSRAADERFSLSSLFTAASFTDSALAEWKQLLEKTSSPHERVVLQMVAEGMTRDDLASLPVGVALPLWDSLFHCREHPPPTSDLRVYDLIGREDTVRTLNSADGGTLIIESPDADDGMSLDNEILKLTFSKDLRINEVKRLLNSSKPVTVNLEQKPEVSDHQFIEEQELTLLTICQRTIALPVGRGMFTLACSKPLPTSPLSVPPLELTGKAPPKNSTVSLDHIEKPVNMSLWAEFHNGVAAGLRISPSAKLDSTWVLSNRPSAPPSHQPEDTNGSTHSHSSPQHAGLLLGLGLSGHLASLMDYELFDYLQEKHELTTIAVLLGITAARVGTMQRSVASILSIFLPPFLPFGSADMEISQTIQTAALVSMGLLYLGSGNRHVSEVMLREISHVPGPELEFSDDRESYALSAGIALGMVTLASGGDLPGLGDLRLVERLSVLILGGPKREILTGGVPQCGSHLVLEPEVVNTHVTSAAATVALGLMFLKTNESSVASRLDAPPTLYELDNIRPDLFILRMASQGLILWDSVQPTQEWINSHIPEIVQRHAFQASDGAEEKRGQNIDHQTLSQAMVCITAGCCMAVGLRYAGTLDQQAHSLLMKNIRFLLTKMNSLTSAEEVGKSCLEMCLNVVVISMAMVMSGSGDLDVLRVVRWLHARVTPPEVTFGSHMASTMALGFLFLGGCRYSLSRSNKAIACLYSAIFPLFPSSSTDNRYHLQALRHLYVLAAEPRVLVTRDVETGQASSVEVYVRGEGGMRGRTPCIVPEWSSIREIEVCGRDFWPVKLDLSGEENRMRQVLAKTGTVFVRRKTGGGGKEGASSLSLPLQFYTTCSIKGKLELFGEEAEGENPLQDSLYSPLLAPEDSQDSSWQRFLTAALLECVSEEKLPVFPSLLHLEKVSHHVLSSPSSPTSQLWQLKLGCALGDRISEGQDGSPQRLLHSDLASVLMVRSKQRLYQFSREVGEERAEGVLRAYFMGEGEVELREQEAEWLAATIIIYGIPPRHSLALTPETTFQELLEKMESLHASSSAILPLLPLMRSKLPQSLNRLFQAFCHAGSQTADTLN